MYFLYDSSQVEIGTEIKTDSWGPREDKTLLTF